MSARRRTYRIETFKFATSGTGTTDADSDISASRHREIMKAIRELRHAAAQSDEEGDMVHQDELRRAETELAQYRRQLSEARKLKDELNDMCEAISQTKQELANLHATGFEGDEMCRVTDELDAVVTGTEQATETILAAAEEIDGDASILVAKLTDETDQGAADDIQQQVVKIFEACNFQDLTGQRISKVVNTLRFIEDRVTRMMDIWGGIDKFSEIEPERRPERTGDEALLNGPALDTDLTRASQDDIDALFD